MDTPRSPESRRRRSVALIGVALAAGSVLGGVARFAAPTTVQAAGPAGGISLVTQGGWETLVGSLPTASWWRLANGPCDQTHMPSYQLGTASFLGMPACGPGGTAIQETFPDGRQRPEWQCVELSERWMYLAWGVDPYLADGSQVVTGYSYWQHQGSNSLNTNGPPLVVDTNNTTGQAPQPGDVLSWGDPNVAMTNQTVYGHTAVVTAVQQSVITSGYGDISIIEENSSSTGTGTLVDTNWKVTDPNSNGGGWSVLGWLHNPTWPIASQPPGGTQAAGPSVAVWPNNGQQDVFWKGTDGNLWEAVWNNGWRGPFDDGMGPLGSEPSAVVNPARCEDDVFWKGTDGNLWEAYWSCGSGWHGPLKVGMGPLGSQPTVGVWASGQQDVFWKGTDGNLWEAYWNNGWHGPYNQGMGPLGSAPSAVVNNAFGQDDVFWDGTDGNLWEGYWAGSWHGPSKVGMGPLGSQPSVGVWANGQQDVFWRGTDGNLWEAYWNNGWHGPYSHGMGPLGSAPSVVVNNTFGQDDVFWKGTDANLWEGYWAGNWYGPTKVGMGPLG
jgi:hypothetical protein